MNAHKVERTPEKEHKKHSEDEGGAASSTGSDSDDSDSVTESEKLKQTDYPMIIQKPLLLNTQPPIEQNQLQELVTDQALTNARDPVDNHQGGINPIDAEILRRPFDRQFYAERGLIQAPELLHGVMAVLLKYPERIMISLSIMATVTAVWYFWNEISLVAQRYSELEEDRLLPLVDSNATQSFIPATQNVTELIQETVSPQPSVCDQVDQEYEPYCLSLPQEYQEQFVQLWQQMDSITVSRFQTYGMTRTGQLFVAEPSDYLESWNVRMYMVPYLQAHLSEIDSAQAGLFMVRVLPKLQQLSELDQLISLIVYGKYCGVMPDPFSQHCFQAVSKMIEARGVRAVMQQLTPLPYQAINYLKALEQADSVGLLPFWETDFKEAPVFAPVVMNNQVLQLLLSDSEGLCKEVPFAESGSYQLQRFQLGDRGELQWVIDKNGLNCTAGLNQMLMFYLGGIFIASSEELPVAGYLASRQGQNLQMAWTMDDRQSGSLNRLLMADFSRKKTEIPASLRNWSKNCSARKYDCVMPAYHLHLGKHKLTEVEVKAAYKNASSEAQLHYVPAGKLTSFSSLKDEYEELWLRLLSYSHEVAGPSALPVSIEEYADNVRRLCGVFHGRYKKNHLLACMQEVSRQYEKDKSWLHTGVIKSYLESFPAQSRKDNTRRQVLTILWNTNDPVSLSSPRILPAVELNMVRTFETRSRRVFPRAYRLGSESYEMALLQDDFSLITAQVFKQLYSQGSFINTIAGTVLLIPDNPKNSIHYTVHLDNPYLADPTPAYAADPDLHSPEKVYPVEYFDIQNSGFPEVWRTTSRFELGQYSCQSLTLGNLVSACEKLREKGHYDAIDVLKLTQDRFGEELRLPAFILSDDSPGDSSAGKVRVDDALKSSKSLIYPRLQELKRSGNRSDNTGLKLKLSYSYSMEVIPAEFINKVLLKSLKTMREYAVGFDRHKLFRDILNLCGVMGEPLHKVCRQQLVERAVGQSYQDNDLLKAYFYRSFSEMKERAEPFEKIGLRIDWHLDKQMNLQRAPSYRPVRITNNGYVEFVQYDSEERMKSRLAEVVLTGLQPDTAYKVWVYNPVSGNWISYDHGGYDFAAAPMQRMVTTALPVSHPVGISRSDSPFPNSFLAFPEGGQKSYAAIPELPGEQFIHGEIRHAYDD